MTNRKGGKNQPTNPMEMAYLSMASRHDRLMCVLGDPFHELGVDQQRQLLRAATAIQEEWMIDGVNVDLDSF